MRGSVLQPATPVRSCTAGVKSTCRWIFCSPEPKPLLPVPGCQTCLDELLRKDMMDMLHVASDILVDVTTKHRKIQSNHVR